MTGAVFSDYEHTYQVVSYGANDFKYVIFCHIPCFPFRKIAFGFIFGHNWTVYDILFIDELYEKSYWGFNVQYLYG